MIETYRLKLILRQYQWDIFYGTGHICAHYDHVGRGTEENSAGPIGQIHNGADDNSSGTSALLELAEAISRLPKAPRRSILFAFWDAEEMEMLGSRDDARLINPQGMNRVVRLLFHFVCNLSKQPEAPDFRPAANRETEALREQLAEHVPTLPDRFGARTARQSARRSSVRISQVVYNSPAARAGLRAGDRIVRFAGREVSSEDYLASAVLLAQNEVPVVVKRESQREILKLSVQLDGNPMRLGVTWREDGAEPGTVILTHVITGFPAANAGLHVGDRIYQVASRDFADSDAFTRLVNNASHTLRLLVKRNGQLRTVVVYFRDKLRKRAA